VSTDAEEQSSSFEAQKDYYERLINETPGWTFAGIYADRGITGTSTEHRAGFLSLMEDCRAGKIDRILTKSVSRFARNTVDSLNAICELKSLGIGVDFQKENIFTLDSKGEFLITIMSNLSQEESRSISENVKWGIRKRFEAGHEVKVPLYGFYHTDDELFLIQDDEAAIVREVFERFVHGEAPAVIMDDMIARGVKPPAGKCWKRLQIDRMIKNEKYAGDVVLQKTYIENHLTHKQIRNHGDLPKFRVENAHTAELNAKTIRSYR
jgi:site-specific DNA recombinase